MEIIRDVVQMQAHRSEGSRGFVPTMGYLHEGHLSLVRRARLECDEVVLSIFVNPLQFGPSDDFERYPRDEERDLALADRGGVDVVFIPEAGEMYPPGSCTEVRVRELEERLEGASRPGHFAGVATVLVKLINITGADRMYMGQKDAQQAVIVGRMLKDLNFNTELVVCPTVRGRGGLAISSRNSYLDERQRAAATAISGALFAARDSGERAPRVLEELVRERIAEEPLVELEYVSATDARTLGEVTHKTPEILLSLAAKVGQTRLIDNVLIESAT